MSVVGLSCMVAEFFIQGRGGMRIVVGVRVLLAVGVLGMLRCC
jgi:hypothetical protein